MRKLIAKIKYLSLILIELIVITQSTNIFARNVLKWSNVYNGGGGETAKGVAVDSSGNVYVTGSKSGFCTIKYNSLGQGVWTNFYNGLNQTYGIAVDSAGNVYVTGQSFKLTTLDYCTIKYNTSGQGIWTNFYNGGGTDVAYGVAVDPIGNVYVTGQSFKLTTVYYCTIKYNSLGKGVWTNFYNDGSAAFAKGVAVDSSGNVYVTGSRSGVNNDYCTIKYNTTGQGIWTNFYDGGSTDYANGIAVDSAGNVYITGYSVRGGNSDYCTIKYNSSGQGVWTNFYNGGNNDFANGIASDSTGNIYVTGYRSGANNDYCTIKYNSSGQGIWTNLYNGGSDDIAYGVAVATNFNPDRVFVTGSIVNANNDYFTYGLPPARPGNFIGSGISTNSIAWTWQDKADDESGYALEDSSYNRIITRPANTTSCSETGFAPNQKWTRHICVTNAMGNVDSALNSAWTYALPPMNLVSTWTTVSSVGLQWQTNTGGCSWFMIQSSPTNTGGWTTFKSNFIVLSDTNTGLEAGKNYWFRVAGFNGAGVITKWVTNGPVMTKKGGLDVLKGDKNPINRNIGKEDSGIPILQVKAIAGIEEGIVITLMTLKSSGSGNEMNDISAVKLYLDINKNGINDGGEPLLVSGIDKYEADDGNLILSFVTASTVSAGNINYYLLTYDFKGNSANNSKYSIVLQNFNCKGATSLTTYIPNLIGNITGATLTYKIYYKSDTKTSGVYPNPYKSGRDNSMIFYNLPEEAEIEIYTISGELKAKLDPNRYTGRFEWDLKKNLKGEMQSGLYLCIIRNVKNNQDYKVIKFGIMK